MTRTAVTIDRIATAAAGLLLLLVGAAAIVFATDLVTGIPDTVTAPASPRPCRTLVALGRSRRVDTPYRPCPPVAAHPQARTPRGHRTTGRQHPAGTAHRRPRGSGEHRGRRAGRHPGIHSAKGRAVRERDRTTLTFTVVVDTPEDIPTIIATTDRLCAQAVTMVGDPNLASRTHLRVPAKRHDRPRVH